jgi:parvulin-like peptidyl-prolyl isomerase
MLLVALVASGERVGVESILIRVNDRIMTVSDFRERLEVEIGQSPVQPSEEELEDFARRAFNTVLEEMVLLERAKEKRITVTEEMLDRAIQDIREENQLEDDDEFEAALAGSGLTVSMLRDRYRQSMLLQRTVQGEVRPTEVTEEEVRQVYEEKKEQYRVPAKVELEQVFFPVVEDESDRGLVLRSARGLVERVRGGNDLRAEATLAGLEVQELGAIPKEDLRRELQVLLEGLGQSGITDPLETGGGVQVIHMIRRIPAGYQPFEEVSDSIRRLLVQDSYQDQTQGMVERLKAEYLVEVHENRLEELIMELSRG